LAASWAGPQEVPLAVVLPVARQEASLEASSLEVQQVVASLVAVLQGV